MRVAALLGFIYVLITVVCVGMSGWSTYHGFLTMFRELALPITLVICAGLAACDIAILHWRSQGRRISGVISLLLLFTIFSGAANYNFLYTNFMRDRLVSERLGEAKSIFESNVAGVDTALKQALQASQQEIGPRLEKIELAIKALKAEVFPPSKEGFGTKAKTHLAEVYALLNAPSIAKLDPPPPGASTEKNKAAYDEIVRRVNEVLDAEKTAAKSASEPLRNAQKLLAQSTETIRKSFEVLPEAPRLNDETYFRSRLDLIRAMNEATGAIDRDVSQALLMSGRPAKLEFKRTSEDGIELNTIISSAESGFQPRNRAAAAGLALLAILIDIIPLMFALIFVRPGKAEEEDMPVTRGARTDGPAVLKRAR